MGVIACYGDVGPGKMVVLYTNPENVDHFRSLMGKFDSDVTIVPDKYIQRLTRPPRLSWWRRWVLRELPEKPEPFAVAMPQGSYVEAQAEEVA